MQLFFNAHHVQTGKMYNSASVPTWKMQAYMYVLDHNVQRGMRDADRESTLISNFNL